MSKLSPMMEHYRLVKAQHPDKILFYQVGDFYEVFFEDAILAAREMEIVLTSRDGNKENAVPLAGIPIHAADTYLNKLLSKGYKIAVCDQVEDAASAKGLVKRAVTRILTPGTLTDPEMLDEGKNNYLAALVQRGDNYYGLAEVDVSTGDFRITELQGENSWEKIAEETRRLQPAECVCTDSELEVKLRPLLGRRSRGMVSLITAQTDFAKVKETIVAQWGEQRWDELNLCGYPLAAAAAVLAMDYLRELKYPANSRYFHKLDLYFPGSSLVIDSVTSRNLELTQTLMDGEKRGSLLGLLDSCRTAMGRRLLRRWVEQPLVSGDAINARFEAVEELMRNPLPRREMRSLLHKMIDLERFCSRLCFQRVNARDLITLKDTLLHLEILQKTLAGVQTLLLAEESKFPSYSKLIGLIGEALVEGPSLSLREGGIIREGYNPQVDRLKKISMEGKQRLLELEKQERERTGIKSLRVGYNRIFGYYIEATRINLDQIPPEYIRRQTLANAERFVTAELKDVEEQITGAKDRLAQMELDLFEALRDEVATYTISLQLTADRLARLDCLQSLAETAQSHRYCRPRLNPESGRLQIKKGRHPMVEQTSAERFVPNDIQMDESGYLLVITGPNMAGKSTYIRSAALICIMAQAGSFVPAESAELPILDRIFARVGANDDLSRGYSTFMVEMQETALILREATPRSLLVLDEIGRGTSTYDGMSIARSVLEYLSKTVRAKTLFSTHYHELTCLEGELPGIRNYTMAVKERGREVIFLRQVIKGRSDRSYGINVARLAGIPPEVIMRAEEILSELETTASSTRVQQLSLLPSLSSLQAEYSHLTAVYEEIKALDINRITPLEALHQLYLLQKKLEGENQSEKFKAGGAESGH